MPVFKISGQQLIWIKMRVVHNHVYNSTSPVSILCRSSTVCVGRLGVGRRAADDRKQSWVFPGRFNVSLFTLFCFMRICHDVSLLLFWRLFSKCTWVSWFPIVPRWVGSPLVVLHVSGRQSSWICVQVLVSAGWCLYVHTVHSVKALAACVVCSHYSLCGIK